MEHLEKVLRRLKLRDLQTLDTVVRCGSMGKAASYLALSQAAISKSIAEMERVIGSPLLERTARGVQPTLAGRILVERGKAVFDEIDGGLHEIASLADPRAGLVRVGTPEPMAGFVSNAIAALVSRYPAMRFDVAVSDTDSLLAMVRERQLDVVLTRVSPESKDHDLAARMLLENQLVIVASQQHTFARRRRVRLEELMPQRWILSPPHTVLGVLAREAFAASGLPLPLAAVLTSSIYVRLSLLRTGKFLTFLPIMTSQDAMMRSWLKVLPVHLPRTPGTLATITLRARKVSPATLAFCDTISAAVRCRVTAHARRIARVAHADQQA